MADGSVIRVHQHAAGPIGGQANNDIGRSRGGLTTKIHLLIDSLGYPVNVLLSCGQDHDMTKIYDLIKDFKCDYLIADKGYDSDDLRAFLTQKNITPVIPCRTNRTVKHSCDFHIYKERNLVERCFNKLKNFRRIATRYEKNNVMYKSMVVLGCILIWLKF
jgi:transposase